MNVTVGHHHDLARPATTAMQALSDARVKNSERGLQVSERSERRQLAATDCGIGHGRGSLLMAAPGPRPRPFFPECPHPASRPSA